MAAPAPPAGEYGASAIYGSMLRAILHRGLTHLTNRFTGMDEEDTTLLGPPSAAARTAPPSP
ncbi:hypothetical protein [Streptomyces litchfieldiae]|uniref:Uncharacterized protein n=1 Tax=Streptomyces litchfieldiae TaxID=3075543 RepID=A0ABU2N0B8_9ACTN|nr:hypothetical protein [Streptomyces sp. DSM 44938]MDT0347336.1 hypothetical protein [Streptomyces sp. DSM 44938]